MTLNSRPGRLDVDLILKALSWSEMIETLKTCIVAIKQIIVIEV